jgi:zinc protease
MAPFCVNKNKQIVNDYYPKKRLQFVIIAKAEGIRKRLKKYGKVI